MAAKKKTPKNSDTRGMNQKGQVVYFEGKKIVFPAQSNVKSTEAFTAKGQKATGLAKSDNPNRFKLTAKTKVKQSGEGFAGSGGTLAAGFAPVKKSNVVNALLTVAMTPGSGQVTRAVAGKLGKKVGQVTGETAFSASSRGLASSTGAGGKLHRTWTPFGQTLRSTQVGTAAQQSARIENLYAAAEKTANIAARRAQTRTIAETVKAAKAVSTPAKLAVAKTLNERTKKGPNTGRNKKR